jgi:hypothetical protein
MSHMILVSMVVAVFGALFIVGCVYVLLKLFAPQVFREPKSARAAQSKTPEGQ